MSLRRTSLVMMSLCFGTAFAAPKPKPAPKPAPQAANRVVRFTPMSDRLDKRIDTTNQIRIEFSTAMVPVGSSSSPDQAAKVADVTCKPAFSGTPRWVDDKTWVYDFETKSAGSYLPGSTDCTVVMKPGLRALNGKPVSSAGRYNFVVDGPNIVDIYPGVYGTDEGSEDGEDGEGSVAKVAAVNEDQIFVITTDTIVDPRSIPENVYFQVQGKASRVGAKLVVGTLRDQILKDRYIDQDTVPRVIVLQANEKFPANTKFDLVWGAGVKGLSSGVARVTKSVRNYQARAELRATLTCYRENATAACSPLGDMVLEFSADIPSDVANQALIIMPDQSVRKPEVKSEWTLSNHTRRIVFKGPFPERAALRIALPGGIKDEAGRPLSNEKNFPLKTATGMLPPLIKFSGRFGIVEANLGKETGIPVTIRNVEAQALGKMGTPESLAGSSMRLGVENFPQVVRWLNDVTSKADYAPAKGDEEQRDKPVLPAKSKTSSFTVPLLKSDKPADTVGLVPLAGPGFYVVEMESKILGSSLIGKGRTMYVPTSALVTNLAVHTKQGRENSLFWVTSLDKGQPVPGAQVSVMNCKGQPVWSGQSDQDGLARYNGKLASIVRQSDCGSGGAYTSGYYVVAQQGKDFTFTHSSWTDGIETYRFGNVSSISPNGEATIRATTVFDRVLVRAGDAISMKHFIRAQTSQGFGRLEAAKLPTSIVVQHDSSDAKYVLPLTWDQGNQIAESKFEVPKNARLGTYTVTLAGAVSASTGSFQVQEFKVPLMKGSVVYEKQDQVSPRSVNAQLSVAYQSGGPAKGLPAEFIYNVNPRYGIYFAKYEYIPFGNGGVEEKTTRSNDQSQEAKREPVSVPVTLDANGTKVVTVDSIGILKQPTRLEGILKYRDANGEYQSIGKNINLYPSNILLGVKADDWLSSKKDIPFMIYATDLKGEPKAGVHVDTQLMEEITYANRERRVGGFYADETVTTVTKANGRFTCAAQSDDQGRIKCMLKAQKAGNYYIVAIGKDEAGRSSVSNTPIHISGRADNYFAGNSDDRIDLVPLKKQYEPGETARLEARFPLKQATVLLTVEREGIISARVDKSWTPQNPYVDVKIEKGYAPNVFVSAFAVRGRVEQDSQAPITGLVDLAKPSFKMGLTKLDVNRKAHELKVEVASGVLNNGEFTAKDAFKPRDNAATQVTVTDANGNPSSGEIALAVVDEGLLELLPNKSWDLLNNMLVQRDLEVETATAQMQVIGKRHYGLKAVPLGGDGANTPTGATTRELFDTLIKWTGRAKLDQSGKATIPFALNDSITSFKIVAIASDGLSKFGQGEKRITSSKDVVAESTLAKNARTGDVQDLEVQVRNTTKQSGTYSVCGTVTFTKSNGLEQTQAVPCQSVSVNGESAASVNLGKIAAELGVVSARYKLEVKDASGNVVEAVQKDQAILPNVLTRLWQAQLAQVKNGALKPVNVEVPQNAVPGVGGVEVKMMDSLTAGLSSLGDYFGNVSYVSFERLVSEAVALNDAKKWAGAMKSIPALIDSNGLLRYFPRESAQGSVPLTAYVMKVSKLTGFEIPADYQQKMQSGLVSYVTGRDRSAKDQDPMSRYVGQVNAIETLARYGQSSSILSSLPKMDRAQLPNGTLIELLSIYDHYSLVTEREGVENYLRTSRLTVADGESMALSSDSHRDWAQLNSADSDMASLIQTIAQSESKTWKDKWTNDVMRLLTAQNSNLRAGKGSWDTSIANALGAEAYRTFSAAYEKAEVKGVTTVELAGMMKQVNWDSTPKGDAVSFAWPDRVSPLAVNHKGTGAPWALFHATAAVPVTKNINSGIELSKSVCAVNKLTSEVGECSSDASQMKAAKIGDIFEITLKIKPHVRISQLAVMDPIPAGAKILGTGLKNDAGNGSGQNWSADFEEKASDGYRAFYSFVGQDELSVVYRIQLNNSGQFQLPATTVEAVYTPATFSLAPNATWAIGQ